jgi:hypothetical protein
MENQIFYNQTFQNGNTQYQHTQNQPNFQGQMHFVAFRNIMRPMSNLQNFQNDYNNTDIQVELVEEPEVKLIDNTYEKNIIQNTVDSVSKVHNMNTRNNNIIQNEEGKYIYNQEIPMASNINNISQKLFQEIRKTNEFKHITIEDIRNLIFKRNIREWNYSIIKGFVRELRAFSNEKSVFMKNVHAHQHPQITQQPTYTNPNIEQHHQSIQIPEISQTTNPSNNTSNHTSNHMNHIKQPNQTTSMNQITLFQNNIQMNPPTIQVRNNTQHDHVKNSPFLKSQMSNMSNSKTNKDPTNTHNTHIQKETVQHFSMTINSDDRNTELYPSPYDFKMVFENKNENIEKIKGTIYQDMEKMTNIVKIQVTSVIIPSTDELENLPYLLLEIEEIGGGDTGSNEWLDKCMGKLFFSQKLGKFSIHTEKLSTIDKAFNTPIDLNCITTRIRKPNGDIWTNETELPLTIELKISNRKKEINQLSLNRFQ